MQSCASFPAQSSSSYSNSPWDLEGERAHSLEVMRVKVVGVDNSESYDRTLPFGLSNQHGNVCIYL